MFRIRTTPAEGQPPEQAPIIFETDDNDIARQVWFLGGWWTLPGDVPVGLGTDISKLATWRKAAAFEHAPDGG